MQLQNIQESVKLFKITRFLEKDLSPDGMDLGEGLISRPAAGLQRQAGCHLPHIFHEYPQNYLFQKVFVTCLNKVTLPLSFHCSSKLQATCYSLHHLKYPTLRATIQAASTVHVCAPLFLSGHPSVTNSRFEYTVDGPMW